MRALALLTPASAEELKGLGWAQLKEKLTWAQFAEAIGKFDILSVCACPVARHLPPCLPPSLPAPLRPRPQRTPNRNTPVLRSWLTQMMTTTSCSPSLPRAPTWKS